MSEEVQLEVDGGVATLTLAAPDRRNSLTIEMAQGLIAACEQIDADAAVGAVVVRGSGGYFCAGAHRDVLANAGVEPSAPATSGNLNKHMNSAMHFSVALVPKVSS